MATIGISAGDVVSCWAFGDAGSPVSVVSTSASSIVDTLTISISGEPTLPANNTLSLECSSNTGNFVFYDGGLTATAIVNSKVQAKQQLKNGRMKAQRLHQNH